MIFGYFCNSWEASPVRKIVTKFGGSSLADARQFAKVKDILLMI